MTTYSGTYSGTAGTNSTTGNGGDGGVGLVIADSGDNTLTQTSTVTGGQGGNGAYGYSSHSFGGAGGIGVDLSNHSTLSNYGTITGGDSGTGVHVKAGGIGVHVDDGSKLINYGTIIGGNPDSYSQAGISVNVDSGIFENAGTVGGAGFSTYVTAVKFGNTDAHLIIDVGAVFNGQVTATAGFDNSIELTAHNGSGGNGSGTLNLGTPGLSSMSGPPHFTQFQTIELDAGAHWKLSGAIGSTETIAFTGDSASLSLDSTQKIILSGFNHTDAISVTGFGSSETIDLKDVALGSVAGESFNHATGLLTINLAGGSALSLNFADPSSFAGEFFHATSDGGTGTDITVDSVACYCPGTLILTERGEVSVESLVIGDRVVTRLGTHTPIRWIGRRSYGGRFLAGQSHILPIRIKAGALEEGLPRRDLLISPMHAMYLDGVLVPAGELVNGVSIIQELVDQVEYTHIELAAHDVIWAEGSASETFIDDDSRMMFHNAAEYAELYPDAERTTAQYCAPRMTEGYALDAIRQKLAVRAGLAASAHAQAALRGSVDHIGDDEISGWAQNPAHPEAPQCLDIFSDGELIAQVLANQYRHELEHAGLGSGRHAFMLRLPASVAGVIEVRRSADQTLLPAPAQKLSVSRTKPAAQKPTDRKHADRRA